MNEADPLYARGYEMLRRVQGEESVARLRALVTDLDAPWEDVAVASYAGVWSRTEALPLKQRTLVTVAVISALGEDDELRTHLRAALQSGWSREELLEALVHTLLYAGAPRGMRALRVALDVFGKPV